MRSSAFSRTATTWEQDYEDYVIKRVEILLKNDFPKRITWLNALLKDPTFSGRHYADHLQDAKVPVPKVEKSKGANKILSSQQNKENLTTCDAQSSGIVECNRLTIKLRLKMESCLQALLTDCNLLNTWISVMEDVKKRVMKRKLQHRNYFGMYRNYFSRSIRKETVMAIQFLEKEVNAAYDQMCQPKVHRCIKCHHRQVAKMDENEYLRKLEKRLRHVRNRCWMLYDSARRIYTRSSF